MFKFFKIYLLIGVISLIPLKTLADTSHDLEDLANNAKRNNKESHVSFKYKSERKNYTHYSARLWIKGRNSIAHEFSFYHTNHHHNKKTPLILIYPGIGGKTFFETYLMNYFTKKGISVAISHYLDMDIKDSRKFLHELTSNLRISYGLVDIFNEDPRVDKNRISLLGVSFGGIRGTYHSLSDERVKSSVLMVAGTPLEEIMSTSKVSLLKKIRGEHIGFSSKKEFLTFLKKNNFPKLKNIYKRSADDFFLVISKKDSYVPTKNQWKLFKMLGNPKYFSSRLGHFGAPLKAGIFKTDKILDFYLNSWGYSRNHSQKCKLRKDEL